MHPRKARKLEAQVVKLESALASASTASTGGGAAAAKLAAENKASENKLKKAVQEAEKKNQVRV